MIRKNLLITLIFTFIFTLSGCVIIEPVLENEDILKYTDKPVIDESDAYDVTEDSMPLYHHLDDDTVSYVDLEEFIEFLKGGLLNYNVDKGETLLFDFRQVVPSSVRDVIGEDMLIYEIEFNHEENTIQTNDLAIFTRLNLVYSVSTNDLVDLSQVEKNDVNPEVVIDLDDYGFDILYENDRYYLPMYLANLFLTGASINLYETDDAIVVFDYGTDTSQVRDNFTSSSLTLEDVKETTNNYLALYFDYFYGLKEDKEIESFETYLEEFELDTPTNFIDHYEAISDFMFSLDDLHTRILDAGHLLPNYVSEDNFLYGSKVNTYSIAYSKSKCHVYPDQLTYTMLDEETHLFQIPSFTFDTGVEFAEYISNISFEDDVVIDLTCNTGGSLQGVVELLLYFTDEQVPVRHINSKTNQIVEEYYTSSEAIDLDVNLYVMTSEVTYSASNVFATVVQDMGIGTIIGDRTLGGSCALVFTVLPNGMIISNSSYMTFIDQALEINDDGIEVDLEYSLPYVFDELSFDLDTYYTIGTRYYVDLVDLISRSRIVFDIMYQDEAIAASEYILTVYDTIGTVIYTETYINEFTLRYDFGGSIDTYDVEIIAVYEYENTMYQDVIFYQTASE